MLLLLMPYDTYYVSPTLGVFFFTLEVLSSANISLQLAMAP